jgi:hypothetical protein
MTKKTAKTYKKSSELLKDASRNYKKAAKQAKKGKDAEATEYAELAKRETGKAVLNEMTGVRSRSKNDSADGDEPI